MKTLFFLSFCISYLFSFDYNLKPIKINDNSYYFYGKKEYFSQLNGGDISNSSFIITDNHVILIDTGTTVEYSKQIISSIKKITDKPIKHIINTHHHPDHFLGNNAFDKNVKIYSTKFTFDEIKSHGDLYISNMAHLIKDAAYTTRLRIPNEILNRDTQKFENYKLNFYFLDGHTESDLVILDNNTKTIYVSDLIFNERALATPHADFEQWIKSLEFIKKLDFNVIVPGHGKAEYSKDVIDENIDYIKFVHNLLTNSAKEGLDVFEIITEAEVPEKFYKYAMFEEEFERTIINHYPSYERKVNQ